MSVTTNPTTEIKTSSQPRDAAAARAGTLSSPIVAALEATWSAIQQRHPEIPDVVIVLASGSVGMPRGVLRLGHFAAMRWHHARSNGQRLPEVFVGGEGLARGAVDILGTLLHEATHALAHVRGIQDCSRQGRYHNRRFQTLAAEMGLDVRQVPIIGWSDTHVPSATAAQYVDQLDRLSTALVVHRYAEGSPEATGSPGHDGDGGDDNTGGAEPTGKTSNAARCACPRRIAVARSVLSLGPITCSICGEDFTHDA